MARSIALLNFLKLFRICQDADEFEEEEFVPAPAPVLNLAGRKLVGFAASINGKPLVLVTSVQIICFFQMVPISFEMY
jgi:hypothetical protein